MWKRCQESKEKKKKRNQKRELTTKQSYYVAGKKYRLTRNRPVAAAVYRAFSSFSSRAFGLTILLRFFVHCFHDAI